MKGLIIKDLYMTAKYCRSNIIISFLFLLLSLASPDNLFFTFYPAMLGGMIPTNILAYDERSRWIQYSDTLPYSRAQIVSGKYIIGLIAQGTIIVSIGIAHAAVMISNGTFSTEAFGVFMMLILTMSLISSSINLPFMFKYGVEKGRLAYYVMVGIVCGGSVAASQLMTESTEQEINLFGVLPIVCLIGIGIFALSWYLSIVFYKNREL
ncbi:MAG: ABC-2 transporter permease [Clostridia bacterium]|nr:ABC-2 transporter permease [Clostridia bacterium]